MFNPIFDLRAHLTTLYGGDLKEFEAAIMFEGTCESQISKTEVGIHFFESHNFFLKG